MASIDYQSGSPIHQDHHSSNCIFPLGVLTHVFQNGEELDEQRWYGPNFVSESIHEMQSHTRDSNGNFWTHLTCCALNHDPSTGRTICHNNELVIEVDGGYRGQTVLDGQASIGVWFGGGEKEFGNEWNISARSSADSSNGAELDACIAALARYEQLVRMHARPRDSTVIIKSDSTEIVEGITFRIFEWKSRAQGGVWGVRNQSMWERLDKMVDEIGRRGTQVLFWWIPREWNTLADSLTKAHFSEPELTTGNYRCIASAEDAYDRRQEEWQEYQIRLLAQRGNI